MVCVLLKILQRLCQRPFLTRIYAYVYSIRFSRTHIPRQKFSMALGAQGAEFMDETGAPQQANSYDCGVYTMVVGEIIACYFNATGNIAPTSEIAAKMNRPSHGGQLSRADDTRKNAFMAGKGAP